MISDAPQFVLWHYTNRCNFSCRHCYSRQIVASKELSPKEAKIACQRIIDSQVLQVNFGGGEDILREDCVHSIKTLVAAGKRVLLGSNGYVLEENKLCELYDAGLSSIHISLDHYRSEDHDYFRGTKYAYDRALNAIKIGTKLGMDMYVTTVVTAFNFDVLHRISELSQSVNAKGIAFRRFRPVLYLAEQNKRLMLDEKQLRQVIELISKIKQTAQIDVIVNYHDFPIEGEYELCPCGRQSLVIRPNGDLAPCTYSQKVIGNILSDNLKRLWRESADLRAIREIGSCLGGDE